MASSEWEEKIKGLLKAELKRRDVTYQQLADKLSAIGIPETPENIANKAPLLNSHLTSSPTSR